MNEIDRETKTGITDYHHLDFDPALVVEALQTCMERVPGCTVGRSANGIGNLCVYDNEGAYVGVIELHRDPEVCLADRYDDDDDEDGSTVATRGGDGPW